MRDATLVVEEALMCHALAYQFFSTLTKDCKLNADNAWAADGLCESFRVCCVVKRLLGLFDLQSASIDAFARDLELSAHILNEDMIEWYWLCSYSGAGNFMNQYSTTLCRIREFSDEEICTARLYAQNFVLYSERRYNLVRDKLGHEPSEEELAGDCSLKTRFSLRFRMGMYEGYNEFRWLVNKELYFFRRIHKDTCE